MTTTLTPIYKMSGFVRDRERVRSRTGDLFVLVVKGFLESPKTRHQTVLLLGKLDLLFATT